VPRKTPRLEQSIRAEAAARLGLLRQLDGINLDPDTVREPEVMAKAIRDLADQPLPSRAFLPNLLDGLVQIERLTAPWFAAGRRQPEHRERERVAGE